MQCVIPCEVDATAGGGSHVDRCGLCVAGPGRYDPLVVSENRPRSTPFDSASMTGRTKMLNCCLTLPREKDTSVWIRAES